MSLPQRRRARPVRVPAPCRILIGGVDDRHAVLAAEPIAAGEVILAFIGTSARRPDRYSIQVGRRTHRVPPPDLHPHAQVAEYGWRFLNHSCAPNAWVRGFELVALADIPADAEITFDYDTTEWDMASPFPCGCGAAGCRGTVRGFRWLDAPARERLLPWLADHLRIRI